MKAYTDYELHQLETQIEKATLLWRDGCKAYFRAKGDIGSCVLGAGIYVMHLGPRQRKPRKKMIISATQVSPAQGSCIWESCKDVPMDYLKREGIEVFYEYGNLD